MVLFQKLIINKTNILFDILAYAFFKKHLYLDIYGFSWFYLLSIYYILEAFLHQFIPIDVNKLTRMLMSCYEWFIDVINISFSQQTDCSKAIAKLQTNLKMTLNKELVTAYIIFVLQYTAKTITLITDIFSQDAWQHTKMSKTKTARET